MLKKDKIILKISEILAFFLLGVLFMYSFLFGVIAKCVYPLKYKETIIKSAEEYGLDRYLVFAVCKEESNFNEKAKSSKGAYGLMQITEDTGKYIAELKNVSNYDLYNAETNVDFGCYYLKYLIDKYQREDTAIVAYNAGEGTVSTWLKNEEYSKDSKTLLIIPYKESREYLKKIKRSLQNYRKIYRNIVDKK
ncbi:MAG: lytic transglycosylase domain-containing protein [Clostridia bacterium]|nr:lytic transglycosylase domain-containing protein [Clostridia bacterium]MBQ9513791.1 lytic transglycosylase domain-containing protein [Clostridia bacterium]